MVVVDFIGLSTLLAPDTDNVFEEALMSSASPGIGLILSGILAAAALAVCIIGFFRERAVQPEVQPI